MKSDLHLHSSFSGDSDTPTKEMVTRAISCGLKAICFTEHLDLDYPPDECDFHLDTDSYHLTVTSLSQKYAPSIEVLFGVELGMQEHLSEQYASYTHSYPFDYVIASQHLLWGQDPYYPAFWEGHDPTVVIRTYFEDTLHNLKRMKDYDSLAHLDYIVRYSAKGLQSYSYLAYSDQIDAILRYLIFEGKALEINTAGLKYGTGHPNPHEDILKRYRELGGELICVGSDAHKPEHIAYDFLLIPDMLRSLGFKYHFIYRNRIACGEKI